MDFVVMLIMQIALSLLAMQISIEDFHLLIIKTKDVWKQSNYIALFCSIVILCIFLNDCVNQGFVIVIIANVFMLMIAVVCCWGLARMNYRSFAMVLISIITLVGMVYFTMYVIDFFIFSPFAIYGFYYRNCPFGNLYGKRFLLFQGDKKVNRKMEAICTEVNVESELIDSLPDFSSAGYSYKDELELPLYDVMKEGIVPDTNMDVLEKVQTLIDKVGRAGGGRVYFPQGKYLFNKNENSKAFLQINYSNIILEGELDSAGNPLSELINCNNTLNDEKFPWLSPFFITTGETLQHSNIFWGVQFKNKKKIITRSASLADPGSDGIILTPDFITGVANNAAKGERVLKVIDASKLQNIKYIVLALFNNPNGDLVHDILATEILRPEWGTALRAGDEMAPSYQDLMEIESIDEVNNIVVLTQPLRRDVELKNTPGLYAVEMLENVCICNIMVSSRWNGLFRHHGFPVYYSVKQSQEMDYGWNGINMKRVAHGRLENVIFKNLTNPLYVMDSRNITVENVLFVGYDGHQGIKVYEHACDNLFRHIEFRCHYADMIGGEGNAYGNVFIDVHYTNPYFKPVDFDFHGFSEGPMSPPSYNLFECIYGFTHIKAAGALYNQPACGRENIWWNIKTEYERKGDNLFISLPYMPKNKLMKNISALRHALVKAIQRKTITRKCILDEYRSRLREMKAIYIHPNDHHILFPKSIVVGVKTQSVVRYNKRSTVQLYHINKTVSPISVYEYQCNKCDEE